MKLVTFVGAGDGRLGVWDDERGVLDLQKSSSALPNNMQSLIDGGAVAMRDVESAVAESRASAWIGDISTIRLLAPLPRTRKNVFCVGRNYKAHIIEAARARGIAPNFPTVPEFFSKPATTIVGHEAGVERHAGSTASLDYEVELGLVIGKTIRDVSREEAIDAIFGYTIVNDISARDAQSRHNQWFKGKSFDTFCPMGPCIVTADEFGDPAFHRISLSVNGSVRQNSSTSDMLFSVGDIVASLAASTTLESGDVIATGTPEGVAFGMPTPLYLQVGDVMEATIEGIGTLRNMIID
ncbi:fumarylacetoacetate hydrolase family protein [Paraburkholderia sediminicola]|uniref:fumarylacetoacetate hydrolase family protein n=1 Tax=Paraburkholderia sediminicola TaxID=458836 RepID=UPI0038B97599